MITLKKIPEYRDFDKHLWADYIELKCLLSRDKEYTGADLADVLFTTVKDLSAEFDTASTEEISVGRPQLKDKDELFINDIFSIIHYRSGTYSTNYPYNVNGKKISVKDDLSELHKLYFYLLLCSHLMFISRTDWHVLTGDFELVSYYALKKCLPKQAIVKIFGTSKSAGTSHYQGKTYAKIAELAKDLNEILLAQQSDFAPQANKDKGIDLVAWIPFKDKRNSLLVCFGQCKCSDEWPTMRFSSSEAQWKNWIHFSNKLNNFSFIPYCYRRAGGEWFDKSSIGDVIVIDRQRIIELIEDLGDEFSFSSLSSDKLMTTWIKESEEEIV